jgi:hypothetical protein
VAAVSAWTETELARKEDFVDRSLAGPSTGGTSFGVGFAKAMSRAGVLGGQLAEASGRPTEPSARAGFLEETLTAMARAWC